MASGINFHHIQNEFDSEVTKQVVKAYLCNSVMYLDQNSAKNVRM